MDKGKVLESTRQIICDLDATTTHIIQARLNHDKEAEGKALFAMEGMIVAAQQQLTFLYDYIYKDLALTWQDIAMIDAIILDTNNVFAVDYSKEISRQKFYEEVLKCFNSQRNATKSM